jgi:hypothetical protein
MEKVWSQELSIFDQMNDNNVPSAKIGHMCNQSESQNFPLHGTDADRRVPIYVFQCN